MTPSKAGPSVLAALAVGATLLALVPRARASADATRAVDPASARVTPQERVTSGGVITLRSPGTPMIKIRKSAFSMGSSMDDVLEAVADCAQEPLGHRCKEEMFSDELPEHRVTLSAFWLDRTEVTVADYRRCVSLRRCRPIPFAQGARRFDKKTLPASLVRFDDARAYCKFRGARLPTEAEFERAARGLNGRRYPWGSFYNSHATNHGRLGLDATDDRDGYAELSPVGSFPQGRTPEGFLDLAGNVAEWVWDRYAPGYPEGAAVDPQGPALGANTTGHVIRGGHYQAAAPWQRGAARASAESETRAPFIGFRCARSDRGPARSAEVDKDSDDE